MRSTAAPHTYGGQGINDRKGSGWKMVLKDLLTVVRGTK